MGGTRVFELLPIVLMMVLIVSRTKMSNHCLKRNDLNWLQKLDVNEGGGSSYNSNHIVQ